MAEVLPKPVYDGGQWTVDGENGDSAENSQALMFERTRIRVLAGEREHVQKKTFTKWINSHLSRSPGTRVSDLYMDLRDGRLLIRLLNILSGEKLQRPTRGKMRIHCLENVDKALSFLGEQHVHLENIGAHDIVDGNPSLTLGLIWTIILRFQIQDIRVEEVESSETRSAKDALLLWCQIKTAEYPNVNVRNFTTSWRDGLAFNALIHKHRPDLINFKSLSREHAEANLQNAFDIAEKKLGIYRLLDTEDVAVEFPDEKSIITYVVTLYHYFSKARADTVQGRRIARVVGCAVENERLVLDYEVSAVALLRWIEETIEKLNRRDFPNSLEEVQQRMFAFSTYRVTDKPKWFEEKGRLEIELYMLQSRLRMNNQSAFVAKSGFTTCDLDDAWSRLETCEHELEMALNEEILRQQRLEQLADKFGRKAAMREKWLNDSQRLVASDRFGEDLSSVEAAFKKQEAIQTDIGAFDERLQNLIALADELVDEKYHSADQIEARKKSILFLWKYLLDLVHGRRERLEASYSAQKILAEIDFILQWIAEIGVALEKEDISKHLMRVDDLLQCHDLLKADISVVGERVQRAFEDASPFVREQSSEEETPQQHVDVELLNGRLDLLRCSYQLLIESSMYRDNRLKEGHTVWQLLDDITIEEVWVKEKISELKEDEELSQLNWALTQSLLNRHRAFEGEIEVRRKRFAELREKCESLDHIESYVSLLQERLNILSNCWAQLTEEANKRKQKILRSVETQEFFAQTDELNSWMLEMLHLVSCEDVGRDEKSAQALMCRHQEIMAGFQEQEENFKEFQRTAEKLTAVEDDCSRKVSLQMSNLKRRFEELNQMSALRIRKLEDAIHLFRLSYEVDSLEAWITEKERFMHSLDPNAASDIEELEVMKHRFDGFERELNASASKVAVVNSLGRQLVSEDHPGSQQIMDRLNRLNQKWADLRHLVDTKREELQSTFGVQTFHIECDETISWIQDKVKIVQSTEDLGRDLSGVMVMQRRLSGLERDLGAIQSKLDQLDIEAEKLEQSHPMEAEAVHRKISQINAVWYELKDTLKRREESMGEAAVLQKFLRDLDHFSQWLTKTQTMVASEDIPDSLQSAEQMLNKHQSIKEEIDRYAPDYAQMRDYGQRVIRDADSSDPQYVFLRERLNALDDGWNELDQMWHQKQNMLSEAMHLQMFERDAGQSELLLKNQEYYLQIQYSPKSLEEAEQLVKKHDDFVTSLNASEEKIQQVWQFAQRLVHESHYAADRIIDRAHRIVERFSTNKKNAANISEQLRESIKFFQFVQDCDDLKEWLDAKTAQAQDDSYRDTRNIHSKYLRHQAFSAEIAANRERLQALRDNGFALAEEQPEVLKAVQNKVEELDSMWAHLEETTKAKGERLFDANRGTLYQQCISDVDRFVTDLQQHLTAEEGIVPTHAIGEGVTAEFPDTMETGDLTRTNIMLTRQAVLEHEFTLKQQQVAELKEQAEKLKTIEPERSETIEAQRLAVEEKFNAIRVPLEAKKLKLAQQKRVHQLLRDVEEEKIWIEEQLSKPFETGDSLLSVRMLERKNETLRMEVDGRLRALESMKKEADELSTELPNKADEFSAKLAELDELWKKLLDQINIRDSMLKKSMDLHQFLADVEEAEAWIGEQELQAMNDETGRDETATRALIRKHKQVEFAVGQFKEKLEDMRSRALEEQGDLYGEPRAKMAVTRLMQLYDSLVDLCRERNHALDSAIQLHLVRREIDDLAQWISEREAICNSNELGTDFEHVSLLRERFSAFAEDTTSRGSERVASVDQMCESLIAAGHEQRAIIALWQSHFVEAWQDLLEMLQTRAVVLDHSWQLQKYFYDCKEAMSLIAERQNSLSDQLGRDAKTVFALQRKHAIFEQDLISVSTLVSSICEQCNQLADLYAGEKAQEIHQSEENVLSAWKNLRRMLDKRKKELANCADMHRFFNLARDLTIWMESILRQMKNTGMPARDVSGVDLLINNHQGLKAEIGARDENFTICINMGKDLLAKRHPRSADIKERCVQLCLLRDLQANEWDERWEHLQLELEVYQFARDAAVAEAWLVSQESYLQIDELGESLDQVENLIRKHEAFEKSIVAQEDRFNALKQLTSLEKREKMPPRQPYKDHRSEYEREFRTWDEKELDSIKDKSSTEKTESAAAQEARSKQALDAAPTRATIDAGAHEGVAGKLVFTGVSAEMTEKADTQNLKEGYLVKKHLWENFNQKASNRSWERCFFVLTRTPTEGCILEMYKDHKHFTRKKQLEDVWTLGGCQVEPATDYHKRSNVFRLTMANGATYMFMARDLDDMYQWIELIKKHSSSTSEERAAIGAVPQSGEVDEVNNSSSARSRSLPLSSAEGMAQAIEGGSRQRRRSRDPSSSRKEKKAGFFSIRKR